MNELICIDPGHFKGSANGALGLSEFEFNIDVALQTLPLLQQNGFRTMITQQEHGDLIRLQQRTDNLKAQGADLCISIHADASVNPSANGFWAFYWPTCKESYRLADTWFRYANNILDGKVRPRKIVPCVPGAAWPNFHMVREPAIAQIPAILCEHGFMTNPADNAVLKKDTYRAKCAEVIARTCCAFFETAYNTYSVPPRNLKRVFVGDTQVGAYTTDLYLSQFVTDLIKQGRYPISIMEV